MFSVTLSVTKNFRSVRPRFRGACRLMVSGLSSSAFLAEPKRPSAIKEKHNGKPPFFQEGIPSNGSVTSIRRSTGRSWTPGVALYAGQNFLLQNKGLTRGARTVSVRVQHPVDLESVEIHRPRNLDWQRASALLYGDWGTSKAYVIGLAFVAAGFSSLPIILAVCVLTALVGLNYMVVCRAFPEGGGVYSAAKAQGRLLAVVGALLLVADLTVTAALSGWAALSYLGVPRDYVMISTIVCILLVGVLNYFGPRHSGSVAVALALPTLLVVILIILLAAPHLTFAHLEPLHEDLGHVWVSFVGVILALSGVEAIANLTGTLKPDSGSVIGRPKVGRAAFKAILPVAIEVSLGTALLGWAMLSLPKEFAPEMIQRKEDMLRFLAEQYGDDEFRHRFRPHLWLHRGSGLRDASLERGEHGDRGVDRLAFHDVTRRRYASFIREVELARCSGDPAGNFRGPAHRRADTHRQF